MARPSFLNVRELARRLSSPKTTRGGKVKQHLRRAIQLETLENRHLMAGNVAGTVFNDLNANGVDDPGENGIAGVTVFIDANASGTLNPGELSTVTDSKGKYNITGVPAGVRDVYEIPPSGFIPTPGLPIIAPFKFKTTKRRASSLVMLSVLPPLAISRAMSLSMPMKTASVNQAKMAWSAGPCSSTTTATAC